MALNDFEEINKLVEDTFKQNAVNYQTNFSAYLMDKLAWRTPVKDGYAKGNWEASDKSAVPNPSRERDRTATGLRARRKAFRSLPENAFPNMGRSVFIKNGVVGEDGNGYIIQLENGKSRQAPMGMVSISTSTRGPLEGISKRAKRAGGE